MIGASQNQRRYVSQITIAHGQLLNWVVEFEIEQGDWPNWEQLAQADEFHPVLLQDLIAWGLLAENSARCLVVLDEVLHLPVIGNVAAGVPIEAIENKQGQLSLPLGYFRERPTYLLRVRGDSMKDEGILDGDLIAVRKSITAGEGNIVVARVDNEVTVKRLQRAGKQVALVPANTDYQPILVAPEDLVVEGLFVGLIRENQPIEQPEAAAS